MFIRFSSVSSSILFTILIDASTLIVSGSFCTVVVVLVIGHSLSGNLTKSDRACQPDYWYQCRLVFYPVLTNQQSDQQCYTYSQSFFSVPSWISSTRVAANVLNQYVSLYIIACTIWESTMWSWLVHILGHNKWKIKTTPLAISIVENMRRIGCSAGFPLIQGERWL